MYPMNPYATSQFGQQQPNFQQNPIMGQFPQPGQLPSYGGQQQMQPLGMGQMAMQGGQQQMSPLGGQMGGQQGGGNPLGRFAPMFGMAGMLGPKAWPYMIGGIGGGMLLSHLFKGHNGQ